MTEGIVIALITGALTLAGTLISGRMTANKVMHSLDTAQAVTDAKVEELTREVREHNGFARRMPVVEEQIRVINHRVQDLEQFHKPNK